MTDINYKGETDSYLQGLALGGDTLARAELDARDFYKTGVEEVVSTGVTQDVGEEPYTGPLNIYDPEGKLVGTTGEMAYSIFRGEDRPIGLEVLDSSGTLTGYWDQEFERFFAPEYKDNQNINPVWEGESGVR